jgi:hypothetical protein
MNCGDFAEPAVAGLFAGIRNDWTIEPAGGIRDSVVAAEDAPR